MVNVINITCSYENYKKKKFKVLSDEKIIKGAYTQYLHLT